MTDPNKPATLPTAPPPKPVKPPIPAWAWLFAAACGLIPILALGGAIPTALGVGGAFGCIATARDANKSIGVRLGICAAITGVCWALFIGLLILVMGIRRN